MPPSELGTRKLRVRRATRLLQLFSLGLLAAGGINFIPLVGDMVTAILAVLTGVAGVVGLSFTWHRALVLFTLLSWATTTLAVVHLVILGLDHSIDVWQWLMFLCVGFAALPPAVLSSAMHLRRVWRPQPLIGEHHAPLVEDHTDGAPAPDRVGATPAGPLPPPRVPERPVWPPPNAPLALGSDLLATGRVVAAVQSGDAAGVSREDVGAAARVATSVWPPPS